VVVVVVVVVVAAAVGVVVAAAAVVGEGKGAVSNNLQSDAVADGVERAGGAGREGQRNLPHFGQPLPRRAHPVRAVRSRPIASRLAGWAIAIAAAKEAAEPASGAA
jgi:hypothetical protein